MRFHLRLSVGTDLPWWRGAGNFGRLGFGISKKKTHLSVPGSWFGDCVLRAHRGKVVLEMSFRKLRPTENNVLQRFSTSNVFLVGGSRAGDFRFFFPETNQRPFCVVSGS